MITIKPRNFRKLVKMLCEEFNTIDYKKSRLGSKSSVTLTDGTVLRGGNLRGLLKLLNKLKGVEYFLVKRSRILAGGSYCIRIAEEPQPLVEEAVEDKVVEQDVEEQTGEIQEPQEELEVVEAAIETPATEPPVVEEIDLTNFNEDDFPDVDWEFVNSTKNNKPSKAKFDKYAETLGIKLSQRNTLENMMKMFKEELVKNS